MTHQTNDLELIITISVSFGMLIFIIYVISVLANKDLRNRVSELEDEVKNLSDWFEQTRKVNLKKRSDEKIIIPPRPIKPRRITQG